MGRYDTDSFGWSGLMSDDRYSWQEGCRYIARHVSGTHFIPSKETGRGYDKTNEVTAAIIRNGYKSVFLFGHSNGNIATGMVQSNLEPYGIDVWRLCLDHTMADSAPLGPNVSHAMDLWAGPPMHRLEVGPGFTGKLIKHDFKPLGHISMTHDEEVLRLAVEFGQQWRMENPER
ncbi:MAG: hypothetical protein GY938_05070 [Ketobacter sp.]|nr:hypothetical protein [Ketobacter sp.]